LSSPSDRLAITHDLTLAYVFSLVIALIMAVVSVAGLLVRTDVNPTDELLRTFVPNDVVNLVIGVPILLGSMWLTRRRHLIGLLLWPGALFYVSYNYLVYVFGTPLKPAFPLYLALVVLSVYTLIGLAACIDGTAVRGRLNGALPVRAAGGVLALFGGLFFARVIGVLVRALVNRTPLPGTELAVLVADFLISPAWVIGGLLLWRREALGYVGGTGLLFQASMLFIALIMGILLQPLLTDAPFLLGDLVAVFVMGLVCFVPFALFVLGVISRQ
jgi:hypothetical protein